MSKPTIKDLQHKLAMQYSRTLELEGELKRLKGSPKVQEQLNYANKTVAALMKEVETLKKYKDNIERNFNNVNECYEGIFDNYEKLKVDYAQIQDNYSHLDKMHNDLIEIHNKVSAENYALKAEIERTNRHINLAENQLNREQSVERQPLVVNHYHNCTINK